MYDSKVQAKELFFSVPLDGFCNTVVLSLRKSYSLEGELYCCVHSLSLQSSAKGKIIIISSANNFFAQWEIHVLSR